MAKVDDEASDAREVVRMGLVIKRAEQALIAEKTRVLRGFDLTVPQYAALAMLASASPASAAQLARACLVSPQSMATVLAKLETKGLIFRRASPMHQHVREARLTDTGWNLLAGADRAALAVERRLADVFTTAEFDQLRNHLERAIAVLASPRVALETTRDANRTIAEDLP